VHYGHIGNVSAKSLSILYGPTIADVHNLLKNNITPHTYTLITDEYLAQTEETITGVDRLCELYNTSRLQRTNAFPKTA
jgi:S-adenosylhomocysteine hydrolase